MATDKPKFAEKDRWLEINNINHSEGLEVITIKNQILRKKELRWTWILLSIIFCVAAILGYLHLFSKSGFFYENKVLSKMKKSYGIEFIVIRELGTNDSGYKELVIAPKNEPETSFVAELANGSYGDGGLPYWGRLSNDYADSRYFYYYPELVSKFFGVQPQDLISMYWSHMEREKTHYSFEYDAIREKPAQYVTVTPDNIDEILNKAQLFFAEGLPYRITDLYLMYKDPRLTVIKDVDPNTDNIITLRGVEEIDNDPFKFSDKLLNQDVLKNELINNISSAISHNFSDRIEALYSYAERDSSGLVGINPSFDENLTDYDLEVSVSTEKSIEDPADSTLYNIYTMVWNFMKTANGFTPGKVTFQIYEGASHSNFSQQLPESPLDKIISRDEFYAQLGDRVSSE